MKRWLIASCVLLLFASMAVIAWRNRPISETFYTDADRIKVPHESAPLRDILWQPPTALPLEFNTQGDDYEPRLSADGMTLFFVRGKAARNADIYVATRTTTGWSDPAPLTAVNSPADDLGPELTADGSAIYFYSNREGGLGGYDLWVARHSPDGWGEPFNLGPLVNSEFNDYGPAVSADGTRLYYASNRPRPDDEKQPNPNAWQATLREDLFYRTYDLYAAEISDRGIGQAVALDRLNTPYNEGSPGVSPFGDFLYFASDRSGGEGAFDLYRSRRLRGEYLDPTNLGKAVNTAANELDPALTLGGYALYFSSDRPVLDQPAPGSVGETIGPPVPAGTGEDGTATPRDYNLYQTTSREVFAETESHDGQPIDWAGLWAVFGPNLLWALLALLLLLALLWLYRGMQQRKMSLLARCLLASMAAHLLLLLLLNAWEVAAGIAGHINRPGRIQVALASPSTGSGIAQQILGRMTEIERPATPTPQSERITSAVPLMAVESPAAKLAIERTELIVSDTPTIQMTADDSRPTEPPPSHEPLNMQDSPAVAHALQPRLPQLDAPAPTTESDPLGSVQPDPAIPAARSELPTPSTTVPIQIAAAAFQTATAQIAASAMKSLVREASISDSAPRPAPDLSEAFARPEEPGLQTLIVPAVPGEVVPQATAAEANAAPAAAMPAEFARRDLPSAATAATEARMARVDLPRNSGAEIPATSFAAEVPANAVPSNPAATTIEPAAISLDVPALQKNLMALTAPQEQASAPSSNSAEAELEVDPVATSPVRADLASKTSTELMPALLQATEIPNQRLDAPTSAFAVDIPAPESASAANALADSAMDVRLDNVPSPLARELVFNLPTDAADTANPQSADHAEAPDFAAASLPATSIRADVPRADSSSPAVHSDVRVALGQVQIPSAAAPDRSIDERIASALSATGSPRPDATAEVALSIDDPDSASPVTSPLNLGLPQEELLPDRPLLHRLGDDRLEMAKRHGGSEETEKAVELALAWLAAHQSPDGRWDADGFEDRCGECGGQTEITADNALTGLSLLCFLGAGHTHTREGPYQQNVRKGLEWLVSRQAANGDLRSGETMYSHGIAAITLSEGFALTADSRLAEPVQRAIRFIDRARHRGEGGWRYDPGQEGDTSVLGWQVMALKSAQMAGVDVPSAAFRSAKDWLKRVAHPARAGLYAYQPGMPHTPSMTAEAMFTRLLLGIEPTDPSMRVSAEYLLEHLPDWEEDPNTYFWYYASLALLQQQGPAWEKWNEAVSRELVEHQRRDGRAAGSWDPVGQWAEVGGRVYQTAICTLILEVYYRYLPLYSPDSSIPADDLPEDIVGTVRGTVKDAVTGSPIAGATVRLSLAEGRPVVATSDDNGVYRLDSPEVPEHFALTATAEGFVPDTQSIERERLAGNVIEVDFRLDRVDQALIVLEAEPEVHHLGDNRFDGQINSQFQRRSEGAHYSTRFQLNPAQIEHRTARAEVVLLVKGVQRRHRLVINGTTLDRALDEAPDDGSFGEFAAEFDPALLVSGENTLEVIAAPSSSDIDDFEFVNIRIRLLP